MRILSFVDRLIGGILSVLVAGMMVLTFADVVGREIFSSPLIIAPELTTIGLAAMVYVGLPLVSLHDEHITISLFENLFRGRLKAIKRGCVALLLAALCVVLAQRLWVHAGKLGAEVMMFLELEKSIIAYGMSILSGITAIAFLVRAAQHFGEARRPSGAGGS
jgi:TRAP-type C4-dicarboxylate transport system permease small subunit